MKLSGFVSFLLLFGLFVNVQGPSLTDLLFSSKYWFSAVVWEKRRFAGRKRQGIGLGCLSASSPWMWFGRGGRHLEGLFCVMSFVLLQGPGSGETLLEVLLKRCLPWGGGEESRIQHLWGDPSSPLKRGRSLSRELWGQSWWVRYR